MALTTAQQNAHLKTIMARVANNIEYDSQTFYDLLKSCIAHVRLGDADSIEAGKFWAQALFEQVLERSANANDLHLLRNHLALAADSTASGVL